MDDYDKNTIQELISELRATFLFEPFSEEQLYWLVGHATVVSLERGEYAFTQNEPADALWILLSGEWRLSRTVGGRNVTVGTSATPGSWAGWLPALDDRVAMDMQTTRPSRLLRIPSAAVEHMFTSGYPITGHLLTGIYQGVQNIMMQTRQQEKMIALGKLSAGLAHELNNPASAAHSAAIELRRVLSEAQDATLLLTTVGRPPEEAVDLERGLKALMRDLAERAATAERLDPLERSDREDLVTAWLDDQGIPESYDAAGTLVDGGLDAAWLEGMAQQVPPEAVGAAIRTIIVVATAGALVDQVERSTKRISELVASVKSHSYMDRAYARTDCSVMTKATASSGCRR